MARSLLALGLATAVAVPVVAQDDGGRSLVIDFGQRLESLRNPDLVPGGEDSVTSAVTSLGLTYSNITRSDRLALGLGSSLRLQDGAEPDFGSLVASLGYGRSGPASGLDLSARYARDEIDTLRPLDLVLLETGEVLDVDDIEALLRETGTRETLSLGAALEVGTDGPLGARVSVETSQLRYTGLSSAVDLQDRDSLRVGLGTRLDLTPATEASLSFGYGWSEETGAARQETASVGAGLAVTRPIATLSAGVTVTEAEAGTRLSLNAGASRDLANGGALSFSLGTTRTTEDETVFSGSGRYAVALSPTTEIAARFERSVADSRDGEDQVRTVADFDLSQALSPVSGLSLSATAVERRSPDGDDAILDTEISAAYQHSLTEDWGLGLGVSRSYRDDATARDTATSDTVFLTLSRSFRTRF